MSFSKDMIMKHKLKLSKKYGQNFLTDDGIIKSIVQIADIEKSDLIVEIGPGVGAMTRELVQKSGFLLAVELDSLLMPALKEALGSYENCEIINEDALKVSFDDMVRDIMKKHSLKNAKVVANLPYYITTPIIMKLLEDETVFNTHVFMVQKEVALRMIAKPGGKDYGALSVAVQFYSEPSIELSVPPNCFIPEPAVYSSVIKLKVNEKPPVQLLDKITFFKVVQASFGQRRKTILNALSNYFAPKLTKNQVLEILEDCNIKSNQRGETLSIQDFANIANKIST